MHPNPPHAEPSPARPLEGSVATRRSNRTSQPAPRSRRIDIATSAVALAVLGLLVIGGTGRPPAGDAAPPPPGRSDHGAAGTARNGVGGSVAPSPTIASWPGTGDGNNGGPFAFIGAHYGALWGIPAGPNNSAGVGYCVMEDLAGEQVVTLQPDPSQWDAGEMARAAAVMASFGGDAVVPYAIDASGSLDQASGEWQRPDLLGGGDSTRRRHIAVNFAVKMFVEDVSPSGVVAGRKLARDTAIVDGSGANFPALRDGYRVAQHLANVADIHHAVGGIALQATWKTPDGEPPTRAGTHSVTVRVTDATGKPVGFVPVWQLSAAGIGTNRSVGAQATVSMDGKSADDLARWNAAAAAGWPTLDMRGRLVDDPRFTVGAAPSSADVTDAHGVARFEVTVADDEWDLAFHAQAPTADVDLYAGTGIQGQITWSGPPQAASIHQRVEAPGRFVVRKVLDQADVQADRDMAGFTFAIEAADGSPRSTATTGTDGRTDPVELPMGNYRVVETGRPAWAAGLGDTGPVAVHLGPDSSNDGAPVEVTYANTVPTPSITTRATDAIDGDKFLAPAQRTATRSVVDEVRYRGLVPGTRYTARGDLHLDDCGSWCRDPIAGGETSFVPETPDGIVEVAIDLPADRPASGTTGVVLQTFSLESSGRVVADHRDLDDLDQTVWFPHLASSLQRDDGSTPPADWSQREIEIGAPIVDLVDHAGLRPGSTYRMHMTLHRRHADGTCTPTELATTVEFTPESPTGRIEMRGLALPGPGEFVAFEELSVLDLAAGEARAIATHAECADEAQTLWAAPPPTTAPTTTPSTSSPTAPPSTTQPIAEPPPITSPTTDAPSTTTPTTTTTPLPVEVPPSIARTGNDGSAALMAGALGFTLLGLAAVLLAHRPRRPERRG